MHEYERVRAALIRGGTSKGVYLLANELPKDPKIRDKVILSIFGSPDERQIDGLGGADPLTSKVAIIEASARENIDIDYTFGYVMLNEAGIDYSGNCGNISSGVGPFAIDEGLVPVTEPITRVRIYNTNTRKIIEAEVQVKNGKTAIRGNCAIDGVPGTGSKIILNFLNSGGAKTGKLLPTGNKADEIILEDGRKIRVSIVDAANPAVFVKANDIGFNGTELPKDTETNPEILKVMEDIRTTAAVMIGLTNSKEEAGRESPAIPKVAFVASPQDYLTMSEVKISSLNVDLLARTKALRTMHKAYAVTGGICVAAAALIEGTVVNEVVGAKALESGIVRIGHPSGVLEFIINFEKNLTEELVLTKAAVARTARRLMDGFAYVPSKIFWDQ
ncbi:MAG: 2-methylaconitate cis-trans isomerase PrpF family protein [Peptococcaceae bacterium]